MSEKQMKQFLKLYESDLNLLDSTTKMFVFAYLEKLYDFINEKKGNVACIA